MPSTAIAPTASTQTIAADLDQHYPLTAAQIAAFRANGYIKLKQVLASATLAHYGAAITAEVQRRNRQRKPMHERTTYEKAFLQIMNLWREHDMVREFSFSRKLARLAAELMGVAGVRMYHDQALYKEAGGGNTPWHCDQYYWPLSNPNSVTVWVPLQAVPLAMGPLAFAVGSHRLEIGRDLEISDRSEALIGEAMAGATMDEGAFDLGEVSFHSGWTFHRAGGNATAQARAVMTVIYIEDGIRLAAPVNQNQHSDWAGWMPGAKIGGAVDTHLNPVIWRAG